jgi:hypothetical protein
MSENITLAQLSIIAGGRSIFTQGDVDKINASVNLKGAVSWFIGAGGRLNVTSQEGQRFVGNKSDAGAI